MWSDGACPSSVPKHDRFHRSLRVSSGDSEEG